MKNKNGFTTIVEVVAVVMIIGVLAIIGIPAIINAYFHATTTAKARNVAEVEKAKGMLTLPASSGLPGAMVLTDTTANLGENPYKTNLCVALKINSLDELTVGGDEITVGTLITKAYYAGADTNNPTDPDEPDKPGKGKGRDKDNLPGNGKGREK